MKLRYLIGDATEPILKPAVIAHVCNNVGAWGAGFVLALSKKNSYPEQAYRSWYDKKHYQGVPFTLGASQLVKFKEKDILIANMIAQNELHPLDGVPPIRYEVLRQCLSGLHNFMKTHNYTLHMPRIGVGLAGGKWDKIETLVKDVVRMVSGE